MLEIVHGDLLVAPTEALVNTVNTVGVIGKGLALQFREAYPAMFQTYRAACAAGEIRSGQMHVFNLGGLVSGPRWIINFPTKERWRDPSRLADIERGLTDLVTKVRQLSIQSIAIPPLGCGLGMKVDREMFRDRFATQAEEAAARHPALRDAVAVENWPAAEALATKLLFEKPKDFWNLLKLQQVFHSDRNPAFREILKVIFGILPGIATREQLAQEHFTRFQATQECDATKLRELGRIFHAYVLDGEVRRLMQAGDFATLRTRDAGVYQSLKAIGPEGLKSLLAYIQANVSLDDLVQVA